MIDILLPTYNGAKYISPLLDSIFIQTYNDFRIIVRDDGSNDETNGILRKYSSIHPELIIIEDNLGNQGTSGSLNILLKHVTSDYFMFCDRDDIWESNKIELSMKEMERLECDNNNIPILVCSDACCFNDNGTVTTTSFFKSQKFVDVTDSYHKMLALNIVQGSTALMNKKVLDVVKFIPYDIFHDWWFGVIVSYYGKVYYIHKPLLRYRQHSSNVVGANDVGLNYLVSKLVNIKKQFKIYKSMYRNLPFKPSIGKWVLYKILFNLRRL